ncbi:MAG: heme NO-binding domain-containing protein [Paracoccaceae bacterium]|nr:heme NO-binding domain-containing protein [Paracoccaceae bacterium]
MHGLINRSIQCFLRDTYGADTWTAVAREARLGLDNFEPMLTYDPALTDAMLDAAAHLLDRPREAILEDLGTYLVSHPNLEALRRLLRFSGVGFRDFLHSLEDMQGRGRLAVPDLNLPDLELFDHAPDFYTLRCVSKIAGVGHVIMGLLRAMADDYGALVLLDHQGSGPEGEVISISLLETGFAEGRPFDLAVRAG